VKQPGNASQAWYADPSGRRYLQIGNLGRWTWLMRCDGPARFSRAIASSRLLRPLYTIMMLSGLIIALGIPLLPLVAAARLRADPAVVTLALFVVLCVYLALGAWCLAAVRAWARSSLICLEWITILIGIGLWSVVAVAIWLSPGSA
jgi:hypothetical protein